VVCQGGLGEGLLKNAWDGCWIKGGLGSGLELDSRGWIGLCSPAFRLLVFSLLSFIYFFFTFDGRVRYILGLYLNLFFFYFFPKLLIILSEFQK